MMESPFITVKVKLERDWMGDFNIYLVETGRAQATVKAYLQDVSLFAVWYELENCYAFDPGILTSIDLRAWREYSLGVERASASTWNRRRSSMRVFTNWAMRRGWLSYDPFQDIKPAKQVELPPRWISKSDIMRMLRALEIQINGAVTDRWRWQAIRDQAIFYILLYAGLREGELTALNLDDIELGPRSGRVIIRRGKGDKRRYVPLNKEVRRALSAWIVIRQTRDHNALFVGKRGRLSNRTIQRVIAELGRKCELKVTPHELRHTFAKRLVDGGTPLTVVQKLMGHARIETTARYIRPGWNDLELAVENV